ncbi:hypothetical protein J4Q44_G00241540 [Coregonus suidteri]|uniref:Uncharacterized protein n=1 Tax=Coregonus suidteri TaxID=861788 RepID=A0AAN8QGW5_9TELE
MGISPQAELHHLIPQLTSACTAPWRTENQPRFLRGTTGLPWRPTGWGMSLSFLLLLLEMRALLQIQASSTTLNALQGTHSRGFAVPWTPVVLWSLASTQFFHATGHLATFPHHPVGCCFRGLPRWAHRHHTSGFTGHPQHLLLTHPLCSGFSVAPPLVCEVGGGRGGGGGGEEGEDNAIMEMRLSLCSCYPQKTSNVVECFCTQILLMFKASGFLVSSVFVLVGVTHVMRVDMAVGHWFKRLP